MGLKDCSRSTLLFPSNTSNTSRLGLLRQPGSILLNRLYTKFDDIGQKSSRACCAVPRRLGLVPSPLLSLPPRHPSFPTPIPNLWCAQNSAESIQVEPQTSSFLFNVPPLCRRTKRGHIRLGQQHDQGPYREMGGDWRDWREFSARMNAPGDGAAVSGHPLCNLPWAFLRYQSTEQIHTPCWCIPRKVSVRQ